MEEGIDTFLFGSRSNFDELCHIVVTELKEKYPNIQRIVYLCKHETGCLVGEGAKMKQQIKQLTGRDVYVSEYEDIRKSDRMNSAGRATHVERNYWMIDDSCFVIIYCESAKIIPKPSGTLLPYNYSRQKGKKLGSPEFYMRTFYGKT